jgi:hypothetical protein
MSGDPSQGVDRENPQLRRPMEKWSLLDPGRQLALREAFGRYLDRLPPTCSLDAKVARFRDWLARQGIDFDGI